ncbi:MAG: transporter [Bradyrhizobium sp.]|nr:transporter [Bradyrhizobium sp.]
MSEPAVRGEWSSGWPVVLAGVIGMSLMNLHAVPLGMLMKPLSDTFGWSRGQISAGLLILTVIQCLLVPLVGLLIPRFGVRRIVLFGALIYTAGLASLALSGASIWSWYVGWVVMGVGIVGICPLIWTTAIVRAFTRRRGLALSLALSGTGLANLVYPVVIASILQAFGWRGVFLCIAVIGTVIILPVLLILMRARPEYDLEASTSREPGAQPERARISELTSDRRVWQILCAALMIGGSVGMFATHLQAMLQDRGVAPAMAAVYFAASGPSLAFGRLLAGMLLDWLPTRLIAALLFLIPAATCVALLNFDGSAAGGIAICIMFGFGYGAETDVFAYLTARYVGPRKYPLVYGLVYGVFGLSYGMAAMLGGAVFDRFGSYSNMLIALIIGVAFAVVLVVGLGAPPPSDAPRTAT